jgi:hypothetical protein
MSNTCKECRHSLSLQGNYKSLWCNAPLPKWTDVYIEKNPYVNEDDSADDCPMFLPRVDEHEKLDVFLDHCKSVLDGCTIGETAEYPGEWDIGDNDAVEIADLLLEAMERLTAMKKVASEGQKQLSGNSR